MLRATAFLVALSVAATGRADPATDIEIAKLRFALGDLLYSNEKYSEAITELEAARKLQPRPDFDYNIARCYERMKDWPRAIDVYTRYVETMPTPLDADKILNHIEELKQVRDAQRVQVPAVPPSRPPSQAGKKAKLIGLIVGGVGVAALAVGVGFGVLSNETANSLSALDRDRLAYDADKDHTLSTQRTVEGAMLGVGAVALVGGVVMYAVGSVRAARSRYAFAPSVGGGGLKVEF